MKLLYLSIFCATCVPSLVWAQTPGAAEASLDAALGQSLTSAPVPGQSFLSISAGGTLMSGRTETSGWSVDAIGSHTTRGGWLFRFEAETARTDYRVSPDGPTVRIENNHLASGAVMHRLRKGMSFIATTGWQQDHLLALDYRIWGEAGVGLHLSERPKFNLLVAPMFAVGRERRGYTETGDKVFDVALLQTMSFRPHDRFAFDEFLSLHIDTTHARDKYVAVNLSALSKITRYLTLKVYYQHQYAQLVPPGQDPRQTTVGTSLQFTLQRAPAASPKP